MSTEKVDVAIVVSASSPLSRSSVHLGGYLAANLALGGHSKVSLVSLPPLPNTKTGGPHQLKAPLRAVQHQTKARREVKADLDLNAPLTALATAAMIIICVDSADTPQCLKLIKKMRGVEGGGSGGRHGAGVVSLQRGVKNGSKVADFFEKDKSVLVLEGAVGLEVVADPAADGCLVCTNSAAKLVMERLKKDKTERGLGLLDVLETAGIPLLYRHHLTTHTWAVTAFSAIAAINALTGGPMVADLVGSRHARLVCAAMLRECRQALKVVAKGGKWEPDLESCCPFLTLLLLERLLCLPSPLFWLLRPLLLPFVPNLPSQAQMDLHAGLETDVVANLREVELLGQSYKGINTPVLSAVLERLRRVAGKKEGVQIHDPAALFREVGSPTASSSETNVLLWRVLAVLAVLLVLVWLLG